MKILLPLLLCCNLTADAQADQFFAAKFPETYSDNPFYHSLSLAAGRKLFQKNMGMIVGLQRGKYTSIELGGEAHWRKISLLKPHIIGATANMEYNFENNVLGYKAGMWMKRGRINLTYGGNVSYYTNFKNGNRFGIGPSVGFRFFGLHLINGYTFLTKDNIDNTKPGEKPLPVNTLYMSIRYYFPVENKFIWDRKTMKKKRARKKAQANHKAHRQKKEKVVESKIRWNIFKLGKKSDHK